MNSIPEAGTPGGNAAAPERWMPIRGGGAGWRLRRYEVLESTSDLCRTLAEAGEPDGLAVLAGRQTAGRGSRGRSWASPAGNLHLSALLRPSESARLAGQWALLAGLALVEGLDAGAGGGQRLSLKWPNDVLLDGRKLAGVLLDSSADAAGGIAWLVVGMGANLATAPAIAGRPTASLGGAGVEAVARATLERLAHWRRIRTLDGFAAVRAAWLARAQPVGTVMSVRLADGVRGGTFAGLGEDGSLLLQTGGRVHGFAAGEVMLAGTPGP